MIEFKLGDVVTYCPYGEDTKLYVVGIKAHQNIWGMLNERVWYQLSPTNKLTNITSVTTGSSIKESIYFGVVDND